MQPWQWTGSEGGGAGWDHLLWKPLHPFLRTSTVTKKEEGSLKERRLFEEVLLVANSPDISLTNVFSLPVFSKDVSSGCTPLGSQACGANMPPPSSSCCCCGRGSCLAVALPMIWVSSLAVFKICSWPLVWKQFYYSVSECGCLFIFLLGICSNSRSGNSCLYSPDIVSSHLLYHLSWKLCLDLHLTFSFLQALPFLNLYL